MYAADTLSINPGKQRPAFNPVFKHFGDRLHQRSLECWVSREEMQRILAMYWLGWVLFMSG